MKHFLRKAFQSACYTFHKIEPLYDRANLWMARAMTDGDFLSIGASRIGSHPLRVAALYYESRQSRGREQLFDTMRQKVSAGDFTPRPVMKLALAMVYEGAAILPRLAMTYPSTAALAVTGLAIATVVATQSPQAVTDVIATWMGSSPHQKWRNPSLN